MSDYHVPVMLEECIDALQISPGGIYLDATYGAGGHSKSILKKLISGHLYGFDQDDDAEANAMVHECFTFVKANFRNLGRFMRLYEEEAIHGILMDLGVSSHQFDLAERGFSYRYDAALDMRMNQRAKLSAVNVLNDYSEKELIEIFSKYGEVRNAKTLASKVVSTRTANPFRTTFQLNAFLEKACIGDLQKYLSQVYQAIRIEVNDEMGALAEALNSSIEVLGENGRLVVMSYHSIEDRMVKNFMKYGNAEGKMIKDDYGNIYRPMKMVNKKVILASEEELKRNSRARSAKLRIATKN